MNTNVMTNDDWGNFLSDNCVDVNITIKLLKYNEIKNERNKKS